MSHSLFSCSNVTFFFKSSHITQVTQLVFHGGSWCFFFLASVCVGISVLIVMATSCWHAQRSRSHHARPPSPDNRVILSIGMELKTVKYSDVLTARQSQIKQEQKMTLRCKKNSRTREQKSNRKARKLFFLLNFVNRQQWQVANERLPNENVVGFATAHNLNFYNIHLFFIFVLFFF